MLYYGIKKVLIIFLLFNAVLTGIHLSGIFCCLDLFWR